MAQGRDADWISTGGGALLQVDPRRRRIARTTSLGMPASALAVGLGSVWVAAADRRCCCGSIPSTARSNGATGCRPPRRPARIAFSGLAVAAGSVWVSQGEQRVLRIDPRSGRTLARIGAPGAGRSRPPMRPYGSRAAAEERSTASIRSPNGGRAGRARPVSCAASRVGGGYVWAMNYRVWKLSLGSDRRLERLDRRRRRQPRVHRARHVGREGVSGQQTRIEPRDDATRTLRTGGLAVHTWVRGNVATVMTAGAHPGPARRPPRPGRPDRARRRRTPARRSGAGPAQHRAVLARAAARRNLRAPADLRRAPPPRAWEPAPEVADLPTSPDGRTWTFRHPAGLPLLAAVERAGHRSLDARHARARSVATDGHRRGTAPRVLGDVGRPRRVPRRARQPCRRPRPRTATAGVPPAGTGARPTAAHDLARVLRRPERHAGERLRASHRRRSRAGGRTTSAAHYGGNAALLRRNPNYDGPRRGKFAAFLLRDGAATAGRSRSRVAADAPTWRPVRATHSALAAPRPGRFGAARGDRARALVAADAPRHGPPQAAHRHPGRSPTPGCGSAVVLALDRDAMAARPRRRAGHARAAPGRRRLAAPDPAETPTSRAPARSWAAGT